MPARITQCLWFDGNAEEAAQYYTSLLPDSRIDAITYAPMDYPGGKAGNALMVEFTLAGVAYVGLNGGPFASHGPAYSIQIHCDDQAECDRLSDALSAVPEAEQCSWVLDRFGLSWQIVPRRMMQLLADPDPARARCAMQAMSDMKRIDIAAVEQAVDQVGAGAQPA